MNADLRLALRQLRKSPGFAVAAVLTLALAIGANAVVFSVLNALVLRPLQVPHSENLYMLERAFAQESTPSQSYPDYIDLRDRNHSFETLVSYDIVGGVRLLSYRRPKAAFRSLALHGQRQLLRFSRHSAISWPFPPQRRRTWQEQRAFRCIELRLLAQPLQQ